MSIGKEHLKQIITEHKITNVGDIYTLLKDSFKEAIHAAYPNSQVQRCIIHMLRNSFKYVSYKDLKKFATDFKSVYKAPTEEIALAELEILKETWGKKYPYAISNWEMNWDVISPFFEFSDDIRRM